MLRRILLFKLYVENANSFLKFMYYSSVINFITNINIVLNEQQVHVNMPSFNKGTKQNQKNKRPEWIDLVTIIHSKLFLCILNF